MKDANVWPSLDYTTCNDYNSAEALVRTNVDLMQYFKTVQYNILQN